MATAYIPAFLFLLFLSSFALLLLTHLPPVTPSLPFAPSTPPSPWPSLSCGQGQSWAVRIHSGPHHVEEDEEQSSVHLDVIANKVAEQAGLKNRGQIGQLEGHYLLCSDSPGSVADLWSRSTRPGDVLAAHPHVLWHSQERVLSRSKRSVAFNDPYYPQQWHLHNILNKGMDINVTGVWERNITGLGVTVVVVDDGVEHTHQDIHPNYSPEGSYDLNSNDPDPMPHPDVHSDNHHGTRCAGEIAAVPNNSFCAVGVAYGSKVAGIRVLDGPLTDSLEAIAFNKHYQINDIYSCSWGPDDDGHTVDGPHPLGKAALQHGVIAGRHGFGSIFVVASGNGGQFNDNCNYDGYANSIYTITIGAVDEIGRKPIYAEECASMLAVTFSSGGGSKLRNIVTSDWFMLKGTGCTNGHTGTSAAAPLAAGMVALMLQVRPCLSWRDVQHIITFTATKCDNSADWSVNGAGFHHSHQHGFGLLNAWRLVNAAKVWESVPFLVSYQSSVLKEEAPIRNYPNELIRTWKVSAADLGQSGMVTLEHVAVTVTITHHCRGNVEIVLVCPSGMTSVIGARRALDRDSGGYQDWTFSTVRCWGENATGRYTLKISDHKEQSLEQCFSGVLKQSQLTLYGSSMTYREVQDRQRLVEEAMNGKYLDSSFSLPCPPGMDIPPEIVNPFTSNNLKFLLLLGCFALFWSLYYTLEIALAHLDLKGILCLGRRQGGHRTRGGRRRRGVEDAVEEEEENGEEEDSGVELQAVLDSKAKAPLLNGERLAT